MHDEQREREVLDSLAAQEYEVMVEGVGYVVRHRTDARDVSRARHLADLADFAELFAWRAEHLVPRA